MVSTPSFRGAITAVNNLKKEKVISDYAVFGGYAVTHYLSPAYAKDLDIIVPVESQEDFHKLLEYFKSRKYFVIHLSPPRKGVTIENIYIGGQKIASRLGANFIDDMPLQFFPGYPGDLYEAAVQNARRIMIEGFPAKVVTIEYLIVTLLKAFRLKDKKRITKLITKADREILNDILSKHDSEKDGLQNKLEKLING